MDVLSNYLMQVDLKQFRAEACRRSFRVFVEQMWPEVSADKFVPSYLMDALCSHLQALAAGTVNRLAVAMPVRHGKSLVSSVLWPGWLLLTDPSLRIISSTYSMDLSLRDSLRTRRLVESDSYKE